MICEDKHVLVPGRGGERSEDGPEQKEFHKTDEVRRARGASSVHRPRV